MATKEKKAASYKEIWSIANPIMLSLIAQNIINVTDTAFLGRVGEIELGASAIGGMIFTVFYMVGFGLATGVQIIVSRRNGEENFLEAGRIAYMGFFLQMLLALIIFTFMILGIPHLLSFAIKSEAVLTAANSFLNIRSWGIVPVFAAVMFRSFFIAVKNTRIILYASFIAALLNVFLDWLLIFGNWGLPQMGLEGAALASVISEAIGALFFLFLLSQTDFVRKYRLFQFRTFKFSEVLNILKLSIPVMMQFFVSLTGWLIFFLIIEKMGETELAVSNIIRSLYLLLMLPGWAFSSATSTLTGNMLGDANLKGIKPTLIRIAGLNLGCTAALVLLCNVFPHQLIEIYTTDVLLTISSIMPFRVVSIALLFFAVAMIIFSAVSGSGNTRTALIIEVITIVVYLAFAWFIGVHLDLSLSWVWSSEILYFILIGMMSYIYLQKAKWYRKRV